MDFRIAMAQERLKLSRAEAASYIDRMDRDRRRWTQFLYGVDWGDPALYDLLINLERVGIEQACRIAISAIQQGGFDPAPESQAALRDLALAARARAALALNPFTSNLEVDAEAQGGAVAIRGDSLEEELEGIRNVIWGLPGVTGLTVNGVPSLPAPGRS